MEIILICVGINTLFGIIGYAFYKSIKTEPVYIDKPVEVIKEVEVEKIVYKDKIIEKPIEKPIEKIVYKDKIIEKPVERVLIKNNYFLLQAFNEPPIEVNEHIDDFMYSPTLKKRYFDKIEANCIAIAKERYMESFIQEYSNQISTLKSAQESAKAELQDILKQIEVTKRIYREKIENLEG